MTELDRGREAYHRREWEEAWASLVRADADASLAVDDVWLLALAAYLTGREDEFVATLERAHRLHHDAGDLPAAARSAFWIGFHLANRGEPARAGGWCGRAVRLLDQAGGDVVERGYLMLPDAMQRLGSGAAGAAAALAADAAAIAQRFDDRDLLALALHLHGRALIAERRVEDGLALLDEVMVAVAADELSPLVTGLIYCSAIGACRSVYALGRAWEWTAALHDWCERQPDLVAYRGECRVYRSELLQFHGAWRDAIAEARRAGEQLSGRRTPAAALASYQQGELHRLVGELADAERAYRAASRAGREPEPGLALLRLAQGDVAAAAASSRRALAEASDPARRARLLPAHIEIMLAVPDFDEARSACTELDTLATAFHSAALAAAAVHARGAVALASGDERAALPHLRTAWREWLALDAPHDAARARLLLGCACRALGDDDGAALEIEAARDAFARLGATADADRAAALIGPHEQHRRGRSDDDSHGLTPRELVVLAHVATGKTNRSIARELSLSEKTVARHLSNIYLKLGLSSRAAATAWAYEHGVKQ